MTFAKHIGFLTASCYYNTPIFLTDPQKSQKGGFRFEVYFSCRRYELPNIQWAWKFKPIIFYHVPMNFFILRLLNLASAERARRRQAEVQRFCCCRNWFLFILVVCLVINGLTLFTRNSKSLRNILIKFLNKISSNSQHNEDCFRLSKSVRIQIRLFLFFFFLFLIHDNKIKMSSIASDSF